MTTFILAQKHPAEGNSPFCADTHTRAPPPLRTKVKDETMKPLMGNVILLLAAHPSVLFQAPDHSHNWDSDLWLTLGTRPSRTSGCHT